MSVEHIHVAPVELLGPESMLPESILPESILSVRLISCGPPTVIEISGEIDLNTAHLITELVEHVARRGPTRVVLDMAGVSFFGADGLRALLHARTTVTAAGGQLSLRSPSHKTCRVLTITRTEHLFAG
jgi:anti-sigma B factor antagonist